MIDIKVHQLSDSLYRASSKVGKVTYFGCGKTVVEAKKSLGRKVAKVVKEQRALRQHKTEKPAAPAESHWYRIGSLMPRNQVIYFGK